MEETNKFVQRVTASKLDRRWTPMTFHPKHQRYLDELLGSDFSLWRLTENDAIIDWGDGDHGATEFFDKGVPFIQGQHLKDLIVDFPGSNPVFISIEKHKRLTRSQLTPGDILVVKKGSIGFVSLLPSSISKANTSAEVAFFRFNDKVDSYFLTTYLSSKYGQSSLLRLSYKSTRPTLGLNELDEVFFPYIDRTAQKYIGNKVRQAERLRERSRNIEEAVKLLHSRLIPDQSFIRFHRKSCRVSSKDLTERLDAHFYPAEVKEYQGVLKANLYSIDQISADTFNGQTQPPVEEGHGVSQATVANLSHSFLNGPYRQVEAPKSLSRCLKEHDLLICNAAHQKSYIGRHITYVQSDSTIYPSTEVMVIRIDREEVPASYVRTYLSTQIGYLQIQSTIRGITAHSYPSDVELIKVPVPEILGKERESWFKTDIDMLHAGKCYDYAGLLTTAAKLLVEALIEGKLSEADLKAAQEDIEQGDTALDREILARLTRKGIDCPKEPPLFPDLEALYEALSDLEGAETTGDESTNGNGRASNVYPLPNKSLPLASETSSGSYDSTEEVPG
jgi:type I restriction enzyme S subunit